MMPQASDPPGVVIAPFMAPAALVGLAIVGFDFHRLLLLSWEEGGAGGEISVFPFVVKGAGIYYFRGRGERGFGGDGGESWCFNR